MFQAVNGDKQYQEAPQHEHLPHETLALNKGQAHVESLHSHHPLGETNQHA